jgi:hypothetical protein
MRTLFKILGYAFLIYAIIQYFSGTHHFETTDKDFQIEEPILKYDPHDSDYKHMSIDPKTKDKIHAKEIHDNEPQIPDDIGEN